MVDRAMLIDAICSTSPPSPDCDRLTQAGFMRFSGNQGGEAWVWRREELEAESDESLAALYARYRGERVG